eukprot:gnl/TRDRNA2_/TRDRNA2_176111_c0_seq27.p1 gnl/TRDRNA2_/TRDRNA2_176111_c0~~gnl/TRDRNA2_/TRDRNA2_176111_c0_seq27.p1  ORF type:complete len:499 (-),score=68.98 gnl/TRDRNA2_/TRDRNA2_176111_c0_seq27:6-1328(-)
MVIDGRYIPGANMRRRQRHAEQLLDERPGLRDAILEHPSSKKWYEERFLTSDDMLTDGFLARFSRELLIVDRRSDQPLRKFLHRLCSEFTDEMSQRQMVLATAAAIDTACGGIDGGAEARWHDFFHSQVVENSWTSDLVVENSWTSDLVALPIGRLLAGAEWPGVGLRRHRAVLLKYCLDAMDVCRSALIDGRLASVRGDGEVLSMVNVVSLDGRTQLLDTLEAPNMIYAAEHLKRLASGYRRQGGRAGLGSLCLPRSSIHRTPTDYTHMSSGSDGDPEQDDGMKGLTGFEFPDAGWLSQKHLRRKSKAVPMQEVTNSDEEFDPSTADLCEGSGTSSDSEMDEADPGAWMDDNWVGVGGQTYKRQPWEPEPTTVPKRREWRKAEDAEGIMHTHDGTRMYLEARRRRQKPLGRIRENVRLNHRLRDNRQHPDQSFSHLTRA